jgi:hypothetical protein
VECLNFVLSLLNSIVLCMSYMCWFDQRLIEYGHTYPFPRSRPVIHTFLFFCFSLLSTPASFFPFYIFILVSLFVQLCFSIFLFLISIGTEVVHVLWDCSTYTMILFMHVYCSCSIPIYFCLWYYYFFSIIIHSNFWFKSSLK